MIVDDLSTEYDFSSSIWFNLYKSQGEKRESQSLSHPVRFTSHGLGSEMTPN